MTTPLLHPVYPDASTLLGGMSRSKLYTEIKSGAINVVRVGRRTYIAHSELERYVASLSTATVSA
ncbi:helix-turn-helix domain-containing protein [Microbacterium deminutum]|uniref:Helix-turn-helix domain-containing protein n=1 Tax=Microbacterium deminutum TaxID=344164 RepID=A0ABP5BRG2_9MICO